MKTQIPIDHNRVIEAYRELGTQTAVARSLGMAQSHVSTILRRHGHGIGRGTPTKKVDASDVIRLWHETLNQHEVSRRLGVHQTTVSRILRAHGLGPGKGHRLPVHDLPLDEITTRYLAGESAREIAESFGVDSEVVRKRLARHGVKRRIGGAAKEKHPNWKGGRPSVEIYRRLSHEVAAICLGRPVPKGWIIHHVDENYANNDPSNLVLFRTQSEHFRFHRLLSKLQRQDPTVDTSRLALENGALALPPPPRPIEFGPDIDWLYPSETPELPAPDQAT